jgi:hypothetical protein
VARPSSTSNFDDRRLTRAVLWTIAVVVAIELAFTLVPENVMIRTMRWMRAWVVREPAAAVQIHGDSVAQGALFTDEIAAALPESTRVFNAALQGTGPEFTYFLLRRQIASGHVPRAIVIAHSPHTFVTQRMGVLAGAFLGWSEMPEALIHGHHFFDTLYGALCKLSFTLRHRDELADLVRGRRGELATWNNPIPTQTWLRSHMGVDEAKWEREGKGPLPPLHPVYREPFVPDAGERELLARTLALARAKGVAVYWLTLPEHEAVAAARDSIHFAQSYYRFVDSLAARGEIRFLRRDFEILPASDFSDYTHLRLPAALKLSREVGEKLRADLQH